MLRGIRAASPPTTEACCTWGSQTGKGMDDFRADVTHKPEENMDDAKIWAIFWEELSAANMQS
ncbi:MAG: hypothetical protein VB071_03025 [Lawsonibacter sp.]|nr:hypothetical protein [Lawsonibacter sp.]